MSPRDSGDEVEQEPMKCRRCGEKVEKAHPLDAVVHPHTPHVCDDCLKPGDEVVDV